MDDDRNFVEYCRQQAIQGALDGLTNEEKDRLMDLAERGAAIPDEPTEAMIVAASDAAEGWFEIDADKGAWLRSSGYEAAYRAMIAVALATPETSND